MAQASGRISVCRAQHSSFAKVVGEGSCRNAQAFRSWALAEIDGGAEGIYVDLGECTLMDSTFLGVLAGVGLRLREIPRCGAIALLRVNDRNRETVRTLGLDRLLTVDGEEDRASFPPESDFRALAGSLPSADRMAGLMLGAHEDLSRADPRNEPKFRDVTGLLRQHLSSRGVRG